MKLCHAGLGELDEEDQLLFLVLASTGMRLSEAFEINEEFEERNCRYTFVGMKSMAQGMDDLIGIVDSTIVQKPVQPL